MSGRDTPGVSGAGQTPVGESRQAAGRFHCRTSAPGRAIVGDEGGCPLRGALPLGERPIPSFAKPTGQRLVHPRMHLPWRWVEPSPRGWLPTAGRVGGPKTVWRLAIPVRLTASATRRPLGVGRTARCGAKADQPPGDREFLAKYLTAPRQAGSRTSLSVSELRISWR